MDKKSSDESVVMSTTKTSTTTSRTMSTASPRHVVIVRTSAKPLNDGASFSKATRTATTTRADREFAEGAFANKASTGVNQVKMTRDQEKKDMQHLNDRFAGYINSNKVGNLEAQNRHVADELAKLKAKWGSETSQVKVMYEAELDEARRAHDDVEKAKARLEVRASTLEDMSEELQAKLTLAAGELTVSKEKVATQSKRISDYQTEIQLLGKQLEDLENDKQKDREKIRGLSEALARAREDLDHETLVHVDTENRCRTLEEQTEFLKSVHDEEMREMMVLARGDSQPESRDFWKHELTQAINEIRQMYDDKLAAMRTEMESNCAAKLQEMRNVATKQDAEATKSKEDCNAFRTTITDIRDKISNLETKNAQLAREIEALRRSKADGERELEAVNTLLRTESKELKTEMDSVMTELQSIMNTKMGLELEIAAYRKLLEGEENRITLKVASGSQMTI